MIEILDVLVKYGALGALVLGIWGIMRGDFRTRQELEQANKRIDDLKIALTDKDEECKRSIVLLREEYTSRIVAQDRDNIYLRNALLQALTGVQRGAAAAERAVAIAEQSVGSQSPTSAPQS